MKPANHKEDQHDQEIEVLLEIFRESMKEVDQDLPFDERVICAVAHAEDEITKQLFEQLQKDDSVHELRNAVMKLAMATYLGNIFILNNIREHKAWTYQP